MAPIAYIYLTDGTILNTDGYNIQTVTLRDIVNDINNSGKGLSAEFTDGVLSISSSSGITIDATKNNDLENIFSANEFNLTENILTNTTTVTTTQTILVEQVTETPVTETIWTTTTAETTRTETITTTQTIDVTVTETILTEQVTETPVTETIWHTTTSETTRTETINMTRTISLSGSTTFEELGIQSALRVTVLSDGTKNILNIAKDTTLDAFYSDLLALGISTSSSVDTTTFSGQGDSYIASDNIEDILHLGAISKTMGNKISNTNSEELYAIERIYGIYSPGQVSLQVGINPDTNSQVVVDVAFSLRGINNLRNIGKDLNTDYLAILDDIISEITAKQTEFGAFVNRLESALDEIVVRRDNLISSRSTLKDADITEVTSTYIQQQILQQASATLLATANQSPSIALQLI